LAYPLKFTSTAKKTYKRLPQKVVPRVLKALEIIADEPFSGLPLYGEFEGKRKFRVGDWRIVYQFFKKEKMVVIFKIESRQGVYK